MQQPDSASQNNLAQRVATWKARLADLGRRNPLIKFRQDSPRSLEILTAEPDILFKRLEEKKRCIFNPIVRLKQLFSLARLMHQQEILLN
ncbi:MAG: hypothetical protein DCF22_23285 [Leptolyngbya sp.]|nr:MAG: hypothetical protein DCF22_23285 [Leptolyngbya sp.]